MTQLKGHNVGGPVVPYTSADVYATHKALYGKGGYRTVATLTERNNIPLDRREMYMLVAVEANRQVYRLIIWSDAASIPNANWEVFPDLSNLEQVDYDTDISGVRDGSNQYFTLSLPFVAGSTKVYYNGVRQQRGSSLDYTEIGTTQIKVDLPPVSDDKLMVEYIVG